MFTFLLSDFVFLTQAGFLGHFQVTQIVYKSASVKAGACL